MSNGSGNGAERTTAEAFELKVGLAEMLKNGVSGCRMCILTGAADALTSRRRWWSGAPGASSVIWNCNDAGSARMGPATPTRS